MNISELKNVTNVSAFRGNFAIVYTTSKESYLINRQGEVVYGPTLYYATAQEGGLFSFDDYENDKHFVFDANSRTILTEKQIMFYPQSSVHLFRENKLIGVCNERFEPIIAPAYEILMKWQDKFLGKRDGNWGVVNLAGEEVVPFIYEDCTTVYGNHEELIHRAVALNGEYFWIDANGVRVSKNTYEYLQPRNSMGYAIMKKDGKLGIIDAEEKLLCLTEYSDVDDGVLTYSRFYWCTPEHIAFYKNGLFGIMDVHGNVMQQPQYTQVDFQAKDYLISCKDAEGKVGVVTPVGKIVIPFDYDRIVRHREHGWIKVCKEGKYGVMDEQGNIVTPIEYDSLSLNGDKQLSEIAVVKSGRCYFINEK